jgi:hypothetical protein
MTKLTERSAQAGELVCPEPTAAGTRSVGRKGGDGAINIPNRKFLGADWRKARPVASGSGPYTLKSDLLWIGGAKRGERSSSER